MKQNSTGRTEQINQVDCSEQRIFFWVPFLRQLYVCTVCSSIFFMLGLCFGAPMVFIPQLRKNANSTNEPLTDDMASWLTSVLGYCSIPWVIILPILAQHIGRKIPFLIVTVVTLVSFIVFYCSTSPMHLLISEILQGVTLASNMTVLIVIIVEYSSPRHRGVFLTIESSIFYWGVWIANVTGTFTHWRNIAIIAFVCCLYSLTAIIMPESPSWLAMNGRFEECAKAHRWLKGHHKESEDELESLIKSQKEYRKKSAARLKTTSWYNRHRIIKETMSAKGFYQPLLLSLSLVSLYHFSGKLVCTMYAVDLISSITSSESAAYTGMLILDAVTILGMQIGCVLSKLVNRRTLLLSSSVIGIFFLFFISLYLYLISLKFIEENEIISIVLLTSFSVAITCGPMIMPTIIFGELIFLRYKCSSLLIITLFSELLMATVLKLSPHIFKALTLHGAFLFYGTSASIFAFILYKYLPETKDKTLQEIENYFKESHETEEDEMFINEKTNDHIAQKC
nr:facilitated trehalose transporter Tret1-2 homolog [Helicoverpa armigera]